ncbi:sporulation protein [Sulfurifustis variabilis]|uniref:Sporulation protein n=1 Tax=Sulfurifustis variabilis TaxID=1675686 RepID=A0A1B4V436_9GAMM|nr:SPOR domain-containing protein [Sulfurifustis variabilis]BAU47302.1 sporulation protein [Sulfurifustis variabilis]
MTQKDPGTEFNPRHRILGAVILVTAAVIFVPMILSERDPPTSTVAVAPTTVRLDDRQSEEVKVAVTDLRRPNTESPSAKPALVSVTAASSSAGAATPAPVPAEPTAKAATTQAAKPAVKAEPTKTAAKLDRGWVVQVGTFSNITNAERLEDKLREQGHAVRTERITLDAGKAVRLQVGPFRDKALALKAQAQIQKEIGLQGVVLAYP